MGMFIFLCFIAMLIFTYGYIARIINKEEEKRKEKELKQQEDELKSKQRIDYLKETYLRTKTPILFDGDFSFRYNNKKYELRTQFLSMKNLNWEGVTNISDKTVTAVELEVKTLNAFNEEVSSFIVSESCHLPFGEVGVIKTGRRDSNHTTTAILKRVMFEDGTIWNNN